jgi:hypothetical protein
LFKFPVAENIIRDGIFQLAPTLPNPKKRKTIWEDRKGESQMVFLAETLLLLLKKGIYE